QPTVAVRTSRRTLEPAAQLRYLLNDEPIPVSEHLEAALLRPGRHTWTVVATHEGRDVVRASSSFVVTPTEASAERLVASLRESAELEAAAWERLTQRMEAARGALRAGRADAARATLREMLRDIEPM